ncbi:MAG: aromatic ring hydroxylase [Syntrophales bacterium]|jgi:4-hydroxyphenylacetate 3-monooxygenase/4-hydroxybutyryl-CoA dehydratase/vinylacetyl-CoA-Delta-isomerase|nr:aromatic ring hydroxylase [Syntrophales bacterium]
MITGKQYRERIAKLKPNVFQRGKFVDRFDPTIIGGINVMAKTYDFALAPEYEGVGVATSHLTGEKINRFTHIHQSMEDLFNKQKMTRLYAQEVGGCIQRCMGVDGLNALSIISHDADQQHGTNYNNNFLEFLKKVQAEDLCLVCAQTDAKGNRPWRPGKQKDPDLYLRVVEKRSDGIIVNGAKAHNSASVYADEIIVLPTRNMMADEKDWAVAFSIPADTEGITLVNAPFYPPQRKKLKAPHADIGFSHSLTIFDNVFVPWERVFLCGETEQAGKAALYFALFHRHSYCGCKAALSEVMTGATALAAEYNGIQDAGHVRHKLAEMIQIVDLIYAAGIAAAVNATKAGSGTYVPDSNYVNAGRMLAGESIYFEFESLAAIAGGLAVTLPDEADFYDPKVGPYLEKYIMRNPNISAENQQRAFRLFQDMMASTWGGHKLIDALHGGGSPIIEKVAIYRDHNIEHSKNIAKRIAGIPVEGGSTAGMCRGCSWY